MSVSECIPIEYIKDQIEEYRKFDHLGVYAEFLEMFIKDYKDNAMANYIDHKIKSQTERCYKAEDVIRVIDNVKHGYGMTMTAKEIVADLPQTNKDFEVTYTCSFTDCDNFKNFGFGEKCIECKRKQSEAKYKDKPQTCNDCDQQRCETCVTEIGKGESKTKYKRASEQREHYMLYKPTYNKDDGRM